MSFLSAALGAATSIGAGLLGRRENRQSQSLNQANVERQFRNAERDRQLQREFAQHGIRWRVEDAKAAGLHPLFALGGSGATFSPAPISVSGHQADTSLARGLSHAGQDLSRAIDATRTKPERVDARMEIMRLDNAQLQNELLKAQINKLNASQVGPPMPVSSSGAHRGLVGGLGGVSPDVEERPLSRTSTEPGRPHQEAGAIPEAGFSRTPSGLAPVPSADVKERIEDQIIPEIMWSLRNNLLPNIGLGTPPPKSWLPAGAYEWRWHPGKQEWQARFHGRTYGETKLDLR